MKRSLIFILALASSLSFSQSFHELALKKFSKDIKSVNSYSHDILRQFGSTLLGVLSGFDTEYSVVNFEFSDGKKQVCMVKTIANRKSQRLTLIIQSCGRYSVLGFKPFHDSSNPFLKGRNGVDYGLNELTEKVSRTSLEINNSQRFQSKAIQKKSSNRSRASLSQKVLDP